MKKRYYYLQHVKTGTIFERLASSKNDAVFGVLRDMRIAGSHDLETGTIRDMNGRILDISAYFTFL